MSRCKTTGMKWAIAVIAILVALLIAIVTYAICTKQIEYVEKPTDAIESETDNPFEDANDDLLTDSKLVLRI